METTKATPAQKSYLAHFIAGPAYVWPAGVNGNTVAGAKRRGLVEYVEGSTTLVQLSAAGRAALGL